MTNPIHMIDALQTSGVARTSTVAAGVVPPTPPKAPTVDFDTTMLGAIERIETQHAQADSALTMLASGEHVDLHGTMIELEKADIALRTMVSVRDRFISAYEQVMNMTV